MGELWINIIMMSINFGWSTERQLLKIALGRNMQIIMWNGVKIKWSEISNLRGDLNWAPLFNVLNFIILIFPRACGSGFYPVSISRFHCSKITEFRIFRIIHFPFSISVSPDAYYIWRYWWYHISRIMWSGCPEPYKVPAFWKVCRIRRNNTGNRKLCIFEHV